MASRSSARSARVAASAVESTTSSSLTSWASSPAVRKSMQGNRSRDTNPELVIRALLHAMGLRYRVDRRPDPSIRRRADIVFGPARVAVFVDGCFWHRCPRHGTSPKSNSDYWEPKLSANVRRDRQTNRLLRKAGWTVVRVWEHEDAERAANRIARIVVEARSG